MNIKQLLKTLPFVEVDGKKYYSFQAFAQAITFKYGYGAVQLEVGRVNTEDYIKHEIEGAGSYKRLLVNKKGLFTFITSIRLEKSLENKEIAESLKEELLNKLVDLY